MQQRTSEASYWGYLGLISLVGTSLRLWDLGGISIWGDEVFGAREAINVYRLEIIPVFEGLLGHVGVLLGLLASGADLQSVEPNDFGAFRDAGVTPSALRLAPALIGSLTVPVAAAMSRRFLGVRQSLVLALLLAIAPWHLYWSQGSRFYVTQFFFYVIAYILYFEATEDQSLKKLTLAMLFFVCAFNVQYTSFVFVFIIAADWLIGRLRSSPVHLSVPALVIICLAIAACVAMPLLLLLKVDSYAASHFEIAGNPAWYLALGMIAFVHPVVVLTALVSGAMKGALPTRNRVYLLLGAFLPILIMSALSFRSYSGSRYGFVCLFPMLALSAAGLVRLYDVVTPIAGRWSAVLPFLLVFGTYLILDVDYFAINRGFRPQWATAAELVRSQYRPGDKVAVSQHHLGLYLLDDLGDHVVIPTHEVEGQDTGVWVVSTREDSRSLLARSVVQPKDWVQSFTTYYRVPRHQISVWYRPSPTDRKPRPVPRL